MLNQAGCPLGGSRATTAPSENCDNQTDIGNGNNKGKGNNRSEASSDGFTVAPVPFKDNLTLKYNFDYTSDVVIEIFDISGNKVFKMKEKGVSAGNMSSINADFVRGQQMYIVRVTTDRDKFEQKAISGN